jgi:hypothetical protein
MVQTVLRLLPIGLGLLLAIAPSSAAGQVGRIFVSAEAYAGVSRVVHVGKIKELLPVDYKAAETRPLTDTQKIGKPHRLVFEVDETIRGDASKQLELVLSLQSTTHLEYMRDHSLGIMLVAGPTRLDSFPRAEVGIEEQGKRVDGDWYQFRVLEQVKVPSERPDAEIAAQLNTYYDEGRMFTSGLEVVAGSKDILKHVRDFTKKHPKSLPAVTLRVPNEFGELCGSPNAYCGITLPICPETKATLLALKAEPGIILRRIRSDNESYYRSLIATEVDKALAAFPMDDE